MRAAWYDHHGSPRDSLVVGEMPDPSPGPGEVRIAVAVSGMSPGDIKKRQAWQGGPMPYPRVIPHSDGAGRIDAVGKGVNDARLGQRVWCYGAQSGRPFGTAAELTVVPEALVVALPEDACPEVDDQAACLGIAGITAHRATFAGGPVEGRVVLVHGAVGGVGALAVQLAKRGGARVLGVVRRPDEVDDARALGATEVFLNDAGDLTAQILAVAPQGVDLIVEVDFSAHIDLDAEILAERGSISSYATSAPRPEIPYWPLGFKDSVVRFLGSDTFAPQVKASAAADLTQALLEGSLRSRIVARFPLEEIAQAHELVEAGAGGRVVLDVNR